MASVRSSTDSKDVHSTPSLGGSNSATPAPEITAPQKEPVIGDAFIAEDNVETRTIVRQQIMDSIPALLPSGSIFKSPAQLSQQMICDVVVVHESNGDFGAELENCQEYVTPPSQSDIESGFFEEDQATELQEFKDSVETILDRTLPKRILSNKIKEGNESVEDPLEEQRLEDAQKK